MNIYEIINIIMDYLYEREKLLYQNNI